jgi:hypothetical protein
MGQPRSRRYAQTFSAPESGNHDDGFFFEADGFGASDNDIDVHLEFHDNRAHSLPSSLAAVAISLSQYV